MVAASSCIGCLRSGLEVTREQLRLRRPGPAGGGCWSMARLRAVAISQPIGLAGSPSRGHRSAAIANASCGRVLGQLDVAEDADQRGQHAAPVLAEDGVKRHGSSASRTGRTSIAPPVLAVLQLCGRRPAPRRGSSASTRISAGEVLLAVDERPVGQQHLPLAVAQRRRRLVGVQAHPAGDVRPGEHRGDRALDRALRLARCRPVGRRPAMRTASVLQSVGRCRFEYQTNGAAADGQRRPENSARRVSVRRPAVRHCCRSARRGGRDSWRSR